MAALSADKTILQAAFVEVCRDVGGSEAAALAFAKALRYAALIGTSSAIEDVLQHLQDYASTSVSHEGSATQFIRSLDAALVAELSHVAVERFSAEIAAGGKDKLPPPGAVRYGSFG